jgi:hypothetical protein
LQAECWRALFGGFAPPAAWQTTAVFFIVVNNFRKKTTFSVKVSTFLVNCQLIQESDCQLNQEKSNKLSTKIRKRHGAGQNGQGQNGQNRKPTVKIRHYNINILFIYSEQ